MCFRSGGAEKILQPYVLIDCGLGEGPFYEEEAQQIRFVDIHKKKLHFVDVRKGALSLVSRDLQDAVGWVGRCSSDGNVTCGGDVRIEC